MLDPASAVAKMISVSVSFEIKTKPDESVENYLVISPKQLVAGMFDLTPEEVHELAITVKTITISLDNSFLVF